MSYPPRSIISRRFEMGNPWPLREICFTIEEQKQKIGRPVCKQCEDTSAVLGLKHNKMIMTKSILNHGKTRCRTLEGHAEGRGGGGGKLSQQSVVKYASADCIVVSGGGQRQSAGMTTCKVCCESVLLLRHHFLSYLRCL